MMNIRPLTYILALASYLISAQSVIEGCWKAVDGYPIGFGTSTQPKLVSTSEDYLYLYANVGTSLSVQSGNTSNWGIGTGSVEGALNYSVVKKQGLRNQIAYTVFTAFTDGKSGGYHITNANLINSSGITPSSTLGFTTPKIKAYGIPDATNSYYMVYRNPAKGSALLVKEISLASEKPTELQSFELRDDAPNFDIYAEVTENVILKTFTNNIYVTRSDGRQLFLDVFSYGNILSTPVQVSTSIICDAPGNMKIIGSDDSNLFIAVKNINTEEVEVYAVAKKAIQAATSTITPKKLASFASSSDVIEASSIQSDGSIYLGLNTLEKVNVIKIHNLNLTSGKIGTLPTIPALSANNPFALNVTSAGTVRIALAGKGGSYGVVKFNEAPSLPKPNIDSLRMGFLNTANPVLVKKNNTFTYCFGTLFGGETIDIKFKNLVADIDTVTMVANADNAHYKIEKTQNPTSFTNNRFSFHQYTVGSYTMSYSNTCFKSDTLIFKIVAQNFTVTESPSVLAGYCQNTTANLSIPAKVEWIVGGYSFQTPTQDTLVVATTTTPASLKKFANVNTVAVNQIPFDNNLASAAYRIYKKVTSTLGCSFTGTASSFTIYKSPNNNFLSLSRAVNKKLLQPSISGSISDTLLYFPWESKTASIGLQPTFDNSIGSLSGAYLIGSLVTAITSGKSFLFSPDTALATVSNNKSKFIDFKLNSFNSIDPSRACSTASIYKFLLKKVSFNDLNLRIIGDSIIKPGSTYTYGIYASDISNKLVGGNYKFKWRVYDVNNPATPVGKRTVELIDTTTLTNTNRVTGRISGKYILKAEIYVIGANTDKLIGTLTRNFEVKTTQVVVTGTGSTIDPNRLGTNVCKVDTFMCSGLYLKSISFSNLSQNRGTCTSTPTVDNTSDSTKFIKVFTGENYQFALKVGDEFNTSDQDSAKIIVLIDFDNDGQVGEEGEMIVSSFLPISEVSVLKNIPNIPENIGDKRMSVILTKSKDTITSKTDYCALLESDEVTIKEDFLIHIESPLQLSVSSFVSPNGDGKNDYLEINGIDERYNTNLKVFNKFGMNMYEKDGVGRSDYKSDGFERNLKPDTYYYYFENGSTTVKGFFEIK